ncbi:alpha/beta hydrolase [Mucilaginibacter segetis]|uniref:Dienelactone hydrolase family protein n=1 Tax=Mucilaginibacter segetis TaxID=2793071 RepID=A0A934PSE2_9SPHI|nr:dienelactone hydrolase family protein [Mucilaginibacter segetis]MBK0378751.1 dienelactone hydrolase family protein [Mucilaginibacter segetis]
MYTHNIQITSAGVSPADAKGAIIMLHGRGGTAANILTLARDINIKDMALYAPQATNQSWYPYSFMAPDNNNQPALNSALQVIDAVVKQIKTDGIPEDKIYFMGFSQGACLTLEFIARNAKPYGGAVAFTGGLIGEKLDLINYKGDFNNTPVLITTGDPDPHVPLSRVEESVAILKKLNADVNLKVYKGRPHTITFEELALADQFVFL